MDRHLPGCLGDPLCRWYAGAGGPSESELGDVGGDNSQSGGQRMRVFKLLGRAELEANILLKFYRFVSRDRTLHWLFHFHVFFFNFLNTNSQIDL